MNKVEARDLELYGGAFGMLMAGLDCRKKGKYAGG